jgi:hypothetical protein
LWLPLLLFSSSLSACLLGGHRQAPAVSPGAADKCQHDSGREESATFWFHIIFLFYLLQTKYNDRNDPDKKIDRQIINIVAATNACTRYGRKRAHNTHNHCRFFQVYIYNMQMQYPVHNKEIPRSLFSSRCQHFFLTCWLIGRHFIMLRHQPTSCFINFPFKFLVDRIAGDQSAALPRPTDASVLIVAGHNSSTT